MHPHRRILHLPDHPPILPVPVPLLATHHHHHHKILPIAASLVAAAILIISTYLFILRRRRNRRNRRNFQHQPPPSPANNSNISDDSVNGDSGGDGLVHHVWLIRTVGLDDAAIEAIGAEEYKPGRFSGVSDCSVCLGEVEDGERVRLLPSCGHLFHVECIDTWLRAHVNCPLCRALVVDPKDSERESPQLEDVLDSEGLGAGTEVTVTVGLEESSLSQGLDGGRECGVESDGGSGLGESIVEDAAVVTVEERRCRSFSKNRIRRANTSKGYSDRKTRLEVMRSLSSSGRGLFFSRN